ncbi:MAG: hypothetical protein ACTHKU_13490 [Verrucomicrobiota bacterium]
MKLAERKSLKCLLVATLLVLMNPARLLACAVCYGEPDAPMTKGLTWAIVALAGIVACVLSGVVVFFFQVGRNSRVPVELESVTESSQSNP